MKTKLFLLILVLLAWGAVNAQRTSPGWSYGLELGLSRGDNQGSDEGVGPLLRGNLQLDMFEFLPIRFGVGFTRFGAKDIYTNNALHSEVRALLRPYHGKKYSPYIYAGYGGLSDVTESILDVVPYYPFGIGLETKIKPGMLLDVALGYSLANSDMLDDMARTNSETNTFSGEKQDGFYSLTVGLRFTGEQPRPVAPAPQPTRPVTPAPQTRPVTPAPVTPAPVTPPLVQRPAEPTPPRTVDTDGDGLSDELERTRYMTDPAKADTDGDGLNDYIEINQYRTDPLKADTDGDGLNDRAEVIEYRTDPLKIDTDGDGLDDKQEVIDYKTNPLKADTDGDGLNDRAEVIDYKTDPLKIDTDGDGLNDGIEVNEYKTNPLNQDTDADGLKDGEEVSNYRTNPLDKDTDKGSKEDGAEVAAGGDPLDKSDDVIDLKHGTSFTLEGIMFETASANIRPTSIPILEQAYQALAANPEVKILIIGHTDNVGSAASNLTLSRRRAESVRNWLINKGIAASRLTFEGRGLTQPRATNDTPEGRQLNRRIEFQIVQ